MTVPIIVATSDAVLRDPPLSKFEDDEDVVDEAVNFARYGSVVTMRLFGLSIKKGEIMIILGPVSAPWQSWRGRIAYREALYR